MIDADLCFVLLARFLQEYEPIYKASVAVAQHPVPQIDRSTSRRKRESDDDEEETGRYGVLLFRDSGSRRLTPVRDVGSTNVRLWTMTPKMGTTQMLWNCNALYHVHGHHVVSPPSLMFVVIRCIVLLSLSVLSRNASISRSLVTSKASPPPT